jgi:hypothetical protein
MNNLLVDNVFATNYQHFNTRIPLGHINCNAELMLGAWDVTNQFCA